MRLSGADRLIAAVAVVVAVVLVAFGVLLASNHHRSVTDQQRRLSDRATTVASVTVALVDTAQSTTQEQANSRLGGKVTPAALEALRRRSGWLYAEVLSSSGKLLGATPGAPTQRALALPAYVKAAIGGDFAWSDVYGKLSSGAQAVEWAVPYSVTVGRRVLVLGLRTSQVSGIITGIMARFKRLEEGRAAVVDQHGIVLASPTQGVVPGTMYPDRRALAATAHTDQADYGTDGRAATAPLPGTPWRVVVAEPKSVLYADINGARAVVPWLILVVLAGVAAVGLWLMRRSNLAAAEIARREANRRYALEINDNVIQRLTVAKLAMETGQSEVTHEKLTDTLREAQELVNQLIGDRAIQSGDLRRRERAPSSS